MDGDAEVSLAAGALLVRELPKAAWRLRVGSPSEVRLALDRIENVGTSGADLQFEMRGQNGIWTLCFASESVASEWLNRLPRSQSDRYRGALSDVVVFERLLDETPPRHLVAMSIIAINNVLIGFRHPNIDNAAHLGGLVGGFVLGFVLPRRLGWADPGLDRGEGTVGAIALACALALLAALPVLQPAPTLAAEQAMRRADLWLVSNEPAAVAELRDALLDVQSGDAERLDAATRVEARFAQRDRDGALRDARAACSGYLRYGCKLVRQFEPQAFSGPIARER